MFSREIIKQKVPFLIFFFFFLLIIQLVIILNSATGNKKKVITSKAETTAACPYPDGIAPVGSNIAANNNPNNYAQLRQLYNAQNPPNTGVQNCYIPVTVIYDLFFLKGNPQGIQDNLQAMKQNGLYPIIRVASYTGGDTWIKLYPPTDAKIMGENLGTALNGINFPRPPIVVYLNEVNLHNEWGGQADPEEFAESFDAFNKGLGKGSNFVLFFPALSYGANGDNGIVPSEFIGRFFASNKFSGKIDGVALNIYGSNYQDIANQYSSQLGAFGTETSQISTVIAELGPVRGGSAVSNCESDKAGWEQVAGPIAAASIQNSLSLATMACFGSVTSPAIVHYDGTNPQLVSLSETGQFQNTTQTTTTTNNQQQTQTVNAATKINFNPQNPTPRTKFQVDISSSAPHTYVYMKIFKQNDDKNDVFRPPTNSDTIPQVIKGNPIHWIYDVPNGLDSGDYLVKFYINCKDATGNNCTEVTAATRTLFIGAGKTNETQTTTATTAQTQQTQTTKQTQKTPTSGSETKIVKTFTGAIHSAFPGTGKITLSISDIEREILNGFPMNPGSFEYCRILATSNADCKNPHDQVVDGDTVTFGYERLDGRFPVLCVEVDKQKIKNMDKQPNFHKSCFSLVQR